MALIKGKQIDTGTNGVATANLVDGVLSADAAGRGKMANAFFDAGTVSNKFDAGAIALDRLAEAVIQADGGQAFTADQSMGGSKLTNLGAPTGDNDAARKIYVDTVAQGLDAKGSSRAATTVPLPACTYNNGASGVGATLTADVNGALPNQDGVGLVVGDRLLVKDQAAQLQNGIYTVTDAGGVSTPWVLTRATDFDEAAEIPSAYTFIEEGTTNNDAGFVCTSPAPIVMGGTAITFTQFSGAGQIEAGDGLTKTGNILNVGAGSGISVGTDSVAVIYGATGSMQPAASPGTPPNAGSLNEAARIDHSHAVTCAAPDPVSQLGSTPAEGSSYYFARSDHVHQANGTPVGLGNSPVIGTAQDIARSDHIHPRDVSRQESVTTENIVNADVVLTDLLNNTPVSAASVHLFLNGLLQQQGAGYDYTISGTAITWLALSGTAVDMSTTDTLIAVYVSQGA
jgi:hypothetical protein